MSYHVSVDVGTSYTAAAIMRVGEAHQDPQILPLGVRATCIPSAVFVDDDGSFVVGDAAERRGMLRPDRLAREFKRRVGDDVPLVMGEHAVLAEDLLASVVRHVVDHAREREGGPADSVTVTHPAAWGEHRMTSIRDAVARAGIEDIILLTEPEAAALSYAGQQRVAPGSTFAVYDLGGGTFDATVLVKDADTFTVLGEPAGLERLGGADFDQEVFAHVVRCLPERFAELDPTADETLQALARLRKECSEAKEALSTDADVTIPVYLPGSQAGIRLVRSEFEAMIEPAVEETVEALGGALDGAGVDPADLSAILLIGGSSRIPLVAQLLSRAFGRPLAVDADPKASIALGAALAAGALQEERASEAPAVLAATAQDDARPPRPAPTHAGATQHGFVAQHGPAHGSHRRTAARAALVLGAVAMLGVATATAAGMPTPFSALSSLAGGSPAEAAQSTSDAPGAGRTAGATPSAGADPSAGPTPGAGPTLLDRAQAALDGDLPGGSRAAGDPADERDPSDRPSAKKSAGRGAGTAGSSPAATRQAADGPDSERKSGQKSGQKSGGRPGSGEPSSGRAPSGASEDAPSTAPGDRPTGSPAPSSRPSSPSQPGPTPAPGQPTVPMGPPPTTPSPSDPPVAPEPTSPAPTPPAPTSGPTTPVIPGPSGPDPAPSEPPAPEPSTPAPSAPEPSAPAPSAPNPGGGTGDGAVADPTVQPSPPEPSSTPVGTPVPAEG